MAPNRFSAANRGLQERQRQGHQAEQEHAREARGSAHVRPAAIRLTGNGEPGHRADEAEQAETEVVRQPERGDEIPDRVAGRGVGPPLRRLAGRSRTGCRTA